MLGTSTTSLMRSRLISAITSSTRNAGTATLVPATMICEISLPRLAVWNSGATYRLT